MQCLRPGIASEPCLKTYLKISGATALTGAEDNVLINRSQQTSLGQPEMCSIRAVVPALLVSSAHCCFQYKFQTRRQWSLNVL